MSGYDYSGYTWCACRDCGSIAAADGRCEECQEAGCVSPDIEDGSVLRLSWEYDCQQPGAYDDESEGGA